MNTSPTSPALKPVSQQSGAWTQPRLIATEEAFAFPELLADLIEVTGRSSSIAVQYTHTLLKAPANQKMLCDFSKRIADMDAAGVEIQLLELVSPGVQLFERELGATWAIRANDFLVDVIGRHPARFAGLAAVAPQAPDAAAREIERAITELGLKGVIINSHTNGHFLDEPEFRPVLAAAVEYRAPIYLHPSFPPKAMEEPFGPYALTGAVWGFQAETGLHAARMIMGGVFDEFPDLQIVLGHMGEGLPYWLFRMDQMYGMMSSLPSPPAGLKKLKRRPSEYIRENFHITTSGMFSNEVLQFGIRALGCDRVMFAVDYPFENCTEAADWLRAAPIEQAERAMIAHRNAERLFRIS